MNAEYLGALNKSSNVTDVEGGEKTKGRRRSKYQRFQCILLLTIFTKQVFQMVLLIRLIYLFLASTSQTCGILIPQPGINPMSPAVEVQIINHWPNSEVPKIVFKSLVYISHCRWPYELEGFIVDLEFKFSLGNLICKPQSEILTK